MKTQNRLGIGAETGAKNSRTLSQTIAETLGCVGIGAVFVAFVWFSPEIDEIMRRIAQY